MQRQIPIRDVDATHNSIMTASPHRWRARAALLASTVLVTTLTPALVGEPTRAATRSEESVLASDAAAGAGASSALPLGRGDLAETRRVRALDKGVTLTVIRRGTPPRTQKARTQKGGPQGPWTVRAVTIDPTRAKGRLTTTYGAALADPEPTSDLSRRTKALVGVNASFFSIGAAAYQGVPAGLTLSGGRVVSGPTGNPNELTLVVDSVHNRLRLASLDWTGQVRSRTTGERARLDQVNRPPRVPEGCRSAKKHRHCARPGQLAAFTTDFGRKTPSGLGTEVVLNGKGCPVDVRERRGVRLTGRQTSLQATGRAALTLSTLAGDGCMAVTHKVRERSGRKLKLGKGTSAVTGRYRLLAAGKIVAPAGSGGFLGRHPRTIAGTTKENRIMFVTIDGRGPGSVGATLREAARVAKALGMRNAINLDGGGSTTMVVGGKLANRPPGAERQVSDALVWIARRR